VRRSRIPLRDDKPQLLRIKINARREIPNA
jgi:hypothetical protein